MPRKFDLDDGSVVLIIGSGAGGGTLTAVPHKHDDI